MKKGMYFVLLIFALVLTVFLFSQKQQQPTSLSVEEPPLATLNDFLISAVQGEYMVKMTVSLAFQDDSGLLRFKGSSGEHDESSSLSALEIHINSLVSNYMLQLKEEDVSNKQAIEEGLKNYINEVLQEELIQTVYIENYVFQ